MSLIPQFEIGIWNAWILTIWIILPVLVLFMVVKSPKTEVEYSSVSSKTERDACSIYHIIIFLTLIYSIFLPLKLGTSWFYVGLITFLLGMIAYMIVMVNFASTHLEREPITKGIYRYSRHPMYLATFFIVISVSIATFSWLFLVLSIIMMFFFHRGALIEEKYCLKIFNQEYKYYIQHTSRWIGFPKSGKK